MNTRRDALRALALVAATPALRSQHQHGAVATAGAGPIEPAFLPENDLRLIAQIVDRIIPRTDTAGAADAGVPVFIDRAARTKPALAEFLGRGLKRMRDAGFAGADASRQDEILAGLNEASDPFFRLMKDLTIDGYYSSHEGLATELGYQGHVPLAEFPGCADPEHLA